MHVLRMMPGEDVRSTLMAWCEEQAIDAAIVVAAAGSLSMAHIRFGGRSVGHVLEGDLEVCTITGTLSRHGLHLHVIVADGQGATTGGHLQVGCLVRTTLELAIQELVGLRLVRRFDDMTGHEELVPEPIPS
jgi:predicted DNA-binding protein with PD1-like motif